MLFEGGGRGGGLGDLSKAEDLVSWSHLSSSGNTQWRACKGHQLCAQLGMLEGGGLEPRGEGLGADRGGGSSTSYLDPPFAATLPERSVLPASLPCVLPAPHHHGCTSRGRHCVTLPTEGAAAAQARPLPLRSPPSSPLASPLRLGGPLPFSAGSLSPPASYTLGPLFPLRRLLSGPLIPMTQSLPPI